MPRLARWLVRAALLYLVLGTAAGGVMLSAKAFTRYDVVGGWLPLHLAWILEGWMVQLALGVACWIVPFRQASAGRAPLGWAAYALLNGGLLAFTISRAVGRIAWLEAAAAVAPLLAAVAFAGFLWPRLVFQPPPIEVSK